MGIINWMIARICRRVFVLVDIDKNGRLSQIEVELAILHIYNIINKRFPGWQNPPTRSAIKAAFAEFDTNLSGSLEPEEFEAFAKSLVKIGPDALFARMGRSMAMTSAIVPGATMLVQRLVGGPVAGLPLHFLAPVVGAAGGLLRALTPWDL